MRLSDTPRSTAASKIGDRMKLHRRMVRVDGRTYTVISPRRAQDVRFSTNRFHGTWHILSDFRGARFLGRMLWGLAYARVPNTVVVIDGESLDPNPFDAARPDPILLAPTNLSPLTDRSAATLRRALRHAEHDGSVRWHTPGLADAASRHSSPWVPGEYREPCRPAPGPQRVARLGGFTAFTASPGHLREYAVAAYVLPDYMYRGTAVMEIDWPNGELQIFPDYRARVSAAQVARREVLATVGSTDAVEERIWARGTQARNRGRFQSRPLEPRQPDPPLAPARPAPTPYGKPTPTDL